jgi:hypothetical protein
MSLRGPSTAVTHVEAHIIFLHMRVPSVPADYGNKHGRSNCIALFSLLLSHICICRTFSSFASAYADCLPGLRSGKVRVTSTDFQP